MNDGVTCTHRLVLPVDTNHHGTLYAGSLLRMALEAAYISAAQTIGDGANFLLRRVLSLECYRPVPVGTMIEIQGTILHMTRAYLVVGVIGMPLANDDGPWMDALLGFVQVDAAGQPAPLPIESPTAIASGAQWQDLCDRMEKLLRMRHRD